MDDSVESNQIDPNASVVFISEGKASAEIKKVRDLCKIIYRQKYRIRRLELHVKALKNVILNERIDSPNAKQTNMDTIDVESDDNSNNEFDRLFDEDWIGNQIAEWRETGELSQICDEFIGFINSNQFD